MRVLVSNDGFSDAGGVQAYLDRAVAALEARGDAVAVAYCNDAEGREPGLATRGSDRFHVGGPHAPAAFEALRRWGPEVCYSHNMYDLGVDAQLADVAPVVKFMHGYFGTCVSGLKMHAFPSAQACGRRFGPACAALYVPRRCGPAHPMRIVDGWRWARSQRTLFDRYAAVVVASEHMRREYVRNGVDVARVHTNPLFATRPTVHEPPPVPDEPHVVFLGRMTTLKGGDLLVRAVAQATRQLGRAVRLTMIGDGPQRGDWESLARRLSVHVEFTGWLAGEHRWPLVAKASVLAIPSVWPEPFGLVGLEAGALGIASIAFDTGGIGEWLTDGHNGVLVRPPASATAFGDRLASVLVDRDGLARLRVHALARAAHMSVDAHTDRLQTIFNRVRPAVPKA